MGEMTERERWAEVEARQFEKNADYLVECLPGWLANSPNADSFQKCAEITIRIDAWKQAARSLRQPYYMRLERESLERHP